MSGITSGVASPVRAFCRATLNFAGRGDIPALDTVEVEIIDGRSAGLPGWETCGFELLAHRSAAPSWSDD
ncbi:MAG TPA: hypothetical protein PLV68_10175, partial [Ilumatobacteraceae bacterium]|nr:hypothetical protein [Ilumatobacteraceae bacterium]